VLVVSFRNVPLLTSQAKDQHAQQTPPQEQTSFGSEAPVRSPVTIPDDALLVLTDFLGQGTTNCLKNMAKLTPERVPASWFVASEIHLNGPNEVDLIVQPNNDTRELGSGCLRGAHVVPFWVLTKGRRYELLLATDADALQVLDSRTNGHRDIQTTAHTAISNTVLLFKFFAQYQLSKKRTEND
jgi:hypothetical protein